MGKNKTKVTGFRIENEEILNKLNIIAKNNCRTRNKEVEFALKQYVLNYESKNGEILLDTKSKETTSSNISNSFNNNNINSNNKNFS